MKKQITGLSALSASPDWVQYYWESSINPEAVDRIDYDEEEDHQVFYFQVLGDEKEWFPDLQDIAVVRLWELPEGQIAYEAYAS